MKPIYRFYTLCLLIVTILGCSDSNVPEGFRPSLAGHSLTISKNKLEFDARGGAENITVHSNNVAWRFTGLPSWLSVNPNSGSSTMSVAFTATENASTDTTRTAMFYLESADNNWSYKTMLSATQKAMESYITPAKNTLIFRGGQDSQTINVSSNVAWKPSSSASWVHAEATTEGKAVTISVEANPADVSRSAIVTLSSNHGTSYSINITQEPAGVTGSTETLEFEKEGGSKSISITSEADWEAKTSESWITVMPSSGNAGSHSLTVTVLENNSVTQRKGNVYVNIGSSAKLQIPVVQKGLYMEVKPATLSFSADNESRQIDVNSNTDWNIVSIPDWVSSNTKNGQNSQIVTITSQKNLSSTSRNGIIKFSKEGLPLSASVDVFQEGLSLSVDNNSMQFTDKASSQYLTINTIVEWNASSSDSWIHLSKTSGTGKSTITVSADENTSENSRNGSIRITAGELSQTIHVNQQGKYFNINVSDKTFTSKGGTLQISFSTNESWTASLANSSSWLSLSSTSGNGDGVINVTASDNASTKSRENTIIISPSNSRGVKVNIKQDGRFLEISTTQVSFPYEGGSSEIITVDTDGSYEITTNESWLSIKSNNSNMFTIVARQNDGNKRTGVVNVEMTHLNNGESYSIKIYVQQAMNTNGYVDLGLPSGTLWAKCNVGADSPLELGKKCTFDSSIENGRGRIPTKEEVEELINYCSLTWEDYPHSDTLNKAVLVANFYGRNGASISIPLRLWVGYTTQAYYWTSTLYDNLNGYAYSFHDGWPNSILIGTSSIRYGSDSKRTELYVRSVLNK